MLACSANEAARLARPHAPGWADRAAALRYEPIVTVYLQATGARLASPMMALDSGPDAPAQFIFDLGALGGPAGRFACAISGAADWVDRGLPATGEAALRQVQHAFPDGTWPSAPTLLHTLAEKRATFRCTPALDRPAADIAGGLSAAGDYVAGALPGHARRRRARRPARGPVLVGRAELVGRTISDERRLAVMQCKVSLCRMTPSAPQ